MTGVLSGEPARPAALHDLRRSAEPAVVLSSLARLSVPSFSDSCTLELSEGLAPVFEVSFPLPGADPVRRDGPSCGVEPQTGRTVITAFDMPSDAGRPSFAGHVVHGWTTGAPGPGEAVIARLLVAHALEVVRYERLAEMARAAEDRSARLAREAMANLSIGEAIGIEMATRHLDRAGALELLHDASRQSGRSLHEVSADVVLAASCEAARDAASIPGKMNPVIYLPRHR